MEILSAVLALEDGSLFFGQTCGVDRTVCGEVVFNTAATGYQEVCTDPSYANQIVLFTSPHIGNVGTHRADNESEKVWVKGLVVLEMSKKSSHWRSEKSFVSFLHEHQITWIEGIDTRKLTRHLRDKGTMKGCIMVGNPDCSLAVQLAKSAVEEEALFKVNKTDLSPQCFLKKIAVYDFGVKANILKKLADSGCSVKVFSGTHSSDEIFSWQPDGVVISNGPGDPARMLHAICETRKLIAGGIPLFGICLGCQLIALAAGGRTKKMRFGHHGTNHPVYDLIRNRTYITSQNHHFAIDEADLPSSCQITHHSLFDSSIQGIRLKGLPIFGFQGHPEGAPGPQDIDGLFEEFLQSV